MKDLLDRIKDFLRTQRDDKGIVIDFEAPSDEVVKLINAYSELKEGNWNAWTNDMEYYKKMTYLAFELNDSGHLKMYRDSGLSTAKQYNEEHGSKIIKYSSFHDVKKQPKRRLEL